MRQRESLTQIVEVAGDCNAHHKRDDGFVGDNLVGGNLVGDKLVGGSLVGGNLAGGGLRPPCRCTKGLRLTPVPLHEGP